MVTNSYRAGHAISLRCFLVSRVFFGVFICYQNTGLSSFASNLWPVWPVSTRGTNEVFFSHSAVILRVSVRSVILDQINISEYFFTVKIAM